MNPSQIPTQVYSPEPIYVGPGQALNVPQSLGQVPAYIIVQQAPQAAPEPSWLRQHSGQLVAGAGAGVLVIGIFLAIAIVAVAVAIGIVASTVGLVVIKNLMGAPTKK